jgi:hypothetical protein
MSDDEGVRVPTGETKLFDEDGLTIIRYDTRPGHDPVYEVNGSDRWIDGPVTLTLSQMHALARLLPPIMARERELGYE